MTKRGKAAAIVPSETKGRKAPMTDDEFMWLLEWERRELVMAKELGKLVCHAALEPSFAATGRVMQEQLAVAGLVIVRAEEGER